MIEKQNSKIIDSKHTDSFCKSTVRPYKEIEIERKSQLTFHIITHRMKTDECECG